jgi:hypothetical protein
VICLVWPLVCAYNLFLIIILLVYWAFITLRRLWP